jgi:hypothetical protein
LLPAPEAKRIADRLEVHHTPKHGSWLNMAEIEFSVLGKRLPKIIPSRLSRSMGLLVLRHRQCSRGKA